MNDTQDAFPPTIEHLSVARRLQMGIDEAAIYLSRWEKAKFDAQRQAMLISAAESFEAAARAARKLMAVDEQYG